VSCTLPSNSAAGLIGSAAPVLCSIGRIPPSQRGCTRATRWLPEAFEVLLEQVANTTTRLAIAVPRMKWRMTPPTTRG